MSDNNSLAACASLGPAAFRMCVTSFTSFQPLFPSCLQSVLWLLSLEHKRLRRCPTIHRGVRLQGAEGSIQQTRRLSPTRLAPDRFGPFDDEPWPKSYTNARRGFHGSPSLVQ